MRHIIKYIIIFCFFSVSQAATQWTSVASGIDYAEIQRTNGYIHAFKINLQKNRIQLALAKDDIFPATTVKWLAQKKQALIAVNGGFFTPLWEPVGLRIQQGKLRSPLQPTSWWHIFYIAKNMPYIMAEKNYQMNKLALTQPDIVFAVQGGPRLLNEGAIPPHLRPGIDERTALGITPEGEVIIIATEHLKISTQDLAKILQAPEAQNGFNCVNALNLDGGSSTQLYVNIGKLHFDVSSFALITDILYVTPN